MDRKFYAAFCCFYFVSHALGTPVSDFFQAITVNNCGTSILAPSSPDRIVGGNNAKHGQYPWMVSLHEDGGDGFEHICGAAVLNENWVVTAAHCFDYPKKPSKYQIYVGLHKQSRLNAKTVQKLKISEIVMHEDFDEDTFQNDIALLRTAKPIDIAGSKGYVNGICLPKTKKDPTGYVKVIGWGHEYEDGVNTDILKEIVLPIIPRDLCNEAYDDDPYDGLDEVTEDMICAGMKNKDSCQSDSGGPLFETNSKGVSTLIGVVSHGNGCGKKFYPGVYTKVSSYMKWIKEKVSE